MRAQVLGDNEVFQRLVLELIWQMRKEEYKIRLLYFSKKGLH